MPVGYGDTGGKYGTISPVSNPSGPPTLKDRQAIQGGEINIYIYIYIYIHIYQMIGLL